MKKQQTTKLIKIVWQQTHRYWKQRCKFAHSTELIWDKTWKIKCLQIINEECDRGPKELKGENARWLKTSRIFLTEMKTDQQTFWIQSVQAARRTGETKKVKKQQSITNWTRKSRVFKKKSKSS